MYEEKKFTGTKVRWLSVLIKLLLLFLAVFLIWYFIINKNNKKKNDKNLGAQITDNISYLKKKYLKYFNESNIPKNKNEETKVYLNELVDSKNSKVIYDKNGKKCSTTSSYGKLVKTGQDTYELKVYLKCKDEADSEIYSVTYKDIIDTTSSNKNNNNNNNNTNNSNNNTNTNNTNNTNTNNNNKTNTNNNTNKTNNNSNKTNTNNNTNKTSKTRNTNNNTSKTNSNSSTSTTKTNTTTTTKTTQQTTTTKTNTTTTVKEETKPTPVKVVEKEDIDVEKITSDPSRIVATEYLLYKLGDGSLSVPEGKYITYQQEIQYYKYCNGNDMVNCHKGFAKIPRNEQAINDLLSYGYTEYPDYTEKITIYIPIIDQLWSKNKEKDGYVYSGESRTHYRVN